MPPTTDVAPSPSAPETQAAPLVSPPRQSPSSFFRDRPFARVPFIVVILVVLAGGFFLWRYLGSYESTDDAQVDGHSMPVSARISGYVAKVNVDDNQVVQ